MRRRTFLHGIAAAVAVAVAPVLLNRPKLELITDITRDQPLTATLDIYRVLPDGTFEWITSGRNQIVNSGVDEIVLPYFAGNAQSYRFNTPVDTRLTEVGRGVEGAYERYQLDRTIDVQAGEEMRMVYGYRRA